jgi:hypothetical protein
MLGQNSQARVYDLARHDLTPLGARVDMAMPAGLIAAFADIDLKDLDAGGL